MIKSNRILELVLKLKLLKNLKGTPYFVLKNEDSLKIIGIKNVDSFVDVMLGSRLIFRGTENGDFTYDFFSRGPKHWMLELKKKKDSFGLTLTLLHNENTADGGIIKFKWNGSSCEYIKAVESMLVGSRSLYHPRQNHVICE